MTSSAAIWERTNLAPSLTSTVRITGRTPIKVDRRPRRHIFQKFGSRDLRVINSSDQLRRLADIGQVFTGSGTGYCSRLQHSEDVAKIAATIAIRLGLSESLASAIGLAHDCGHSPFSHTGERTLRRFVPGFDHAIHGADICLVDLDLAPPTLDGIRNHSWSRPNPGTAEAEIVRWADRIAYLTRDMQDAIDLGFITSASIPHSITRELGHSHQEQVESLIEGIVYAGRTHAVIGMASDLAIALAEFRSFNSAMFYKSATIANQSLTAQQIVEAAVRAIAGHTPQRPAGPARLRDAAMQIASLSDRSIIDLWGPIETVPNASAGSSRSMLFVDRHPQVG
jgi:dGTPase